MNDPRRDIFELLIVALALIAVAAYDVQLSKCRSGTPFKIGEAVYTCVKAE